MPPSMCPVGDPFHIARVTERDFDRMINAAGGRRVVGDSSVENIPNADYLLGGAIIELKLIEEEGFEKEARQRRLATLFREYQPEYPVIVVDPAALDAEGQRCYLGIVAGPIQTAVKTAARQLEQTKQNLDTEASRVALVINNGYTALSEDDFTRVVLKAARNDTTKIDSVIVGGIYYYTDDFDSWVIFPFEERPINLSKSWKGFSSLKHQWDAFANEIMTDYIRRGDVGGRPRKAPVDDLVFEFDGIRFVKPSLQVGVPSNFWGPERPRRNSTGLESCPPVGMVFPDLDEATWQQLAARIEYTSFLKESYPEWLEFRDAELRKTSNPLRPLVPTGVAYQEFSSWCQERVQPLGDSALLQYAAFRFDELVREIISKARDVVEVSIVPTRYVFVETHEIGRDRANDFSSITLRTETLSGTNDEQCVRFQRIFHEHALAVGAAYAVKHGVHVILFQRVRTYAWI
jgi:hypothetical protein